MAKRWDDSRFPWAFRSKGYIRALRRTFQFALKSPGPGLMPLINIRDNPPRVSPFPTGNTCKPRLYQPLGSPKESRMGTPNLELDFTWNELLPVVGRVMSLEGCEERGSGRKRLIEEKFRFRRGEGAVKRRARSIRNRITRGLGGGVARSWLNYRFGIEIKRRVRLFIFTRSCNLRSGGEYLWAARPVDT